MAVTSDCHSSSVFSSCLVSRLWLVLLISAEVWFSFSQMDGDFFVDPTHNTGGDYFLCEPRAFQNNTWMSDFINSQQRGSHQYIDVPFLLTNDLQNFEPKFWMYPAEELRRVISEDYSSAYQFGFIFIHLQFLWRLIKKHLLLKPESWNVAT